VDPAQFFAASRLVIVAGKGGVGKTTVTAALARAAARTGLSTLIIEVEGKSGLASVFGREPLSYDSGSRPNTDAKPLLPSTSMINVDRPVRDAARASAAVTVVLPTPPFPATMTSRDAAKNCAGSTRRAFGTRACAD